MGIVSLPSFTRSAVVSYSRVMYPIPPGNNRPALFLCEYPSSFIQQVQYHIFFNSINPPNIKSSPNELWFAAKLCMCGNEVRMLPASAAGAAASSCYHNVTLTLPPHSSQSPVLSSDTAVITPQKIPAPPLSCSWLQFDQCAGPGVEQMIHSPQQCQHSSHWDNSVTIL